MAAATTSSRYVDFELSYTGSQKYSGDWNITTVDVKLKFRGAYREISASINQDISPSREQLLRFTTRTVSGNLIQDKLNERTVDHISLSPKLAKTIKLSARIFQAYESRSHCLTQQPNGSWRGETRARCDDLSISISKLPEFEGGKYYRIKVANDDEKGLNATFVESDSEILNAQRKEQALKAEAQHETDQALRDLQSRIDTLSQPGQNLPELNAFNLSELQTRLADAKTTALELSELETRLADVNAYESRITDQTLTEIEEETSKRMGEKLEIRVRKRNRAVARLKKMVTNKLCKQVVERGDFNLLLRKVSADPKQTRVLLFLIEYKIELNIDTASRGATSGTAMDVARKYKNQEAINILSL